MSYGMQILGEGLGVQIDGENPLLACVETGTFSVVASTVTAQVFTLTRTGRKPRLALRGVNCYAALRYTSKSGSSYTWTIIVIKSGSAPTLNWYLYDTTPPTPRTSGFGMEICNSAGDVIFSDIYPIMQIVGTALTATLTSGRTYAQYTPFPPWYNEIVEVGDTLGGPPTFVQYTYIGGYKWDDNIISTDDITSSTYGMAYSGNWGTDPDILLLDVTNV